MPKLISEIAAGQQFSRSTTDGKLSDSQVRTFRILLNQPGEILDVQSACGIRIGDRHPYNTNIYCVSWDVKFDGESRTVLLATFNYQSTASSKGEDKNDQPPDVRPANWSTSTSLIEVPVKTWREVYRGDNVQLPEPAVNPVGDLIDGISKFEAIVTITIEQYVANDPTKFCSYAGYVNEKPFIVGSLYCFSGSVMFRGVQAKPTVGSWGDYTYRGWTATYEFAYRKNYVEGLYDMVTGQTFDEPIGWDLAVPQTGFNVLCRLNDANVEKSGMPLKHSEGKIVGWPNEVSLPDNVAAGQKARGMVLVHEYENGGASQLPCAQPIPLNSQGSPRSPTADPKVIIRRWRTNGMIDFKQEFGLRLE